MNKKTKVNYLNKALLVAVPILGFITFVIFSKPEVQSKKLNIVTSFYPLYFVASQITTELADVSNITPSGTEPHDYEPSIRDFQKIQNSDLLFINGLGLEPWAQKLGDLKSNNLKIVTVSDNLQILETEHDGEIEQDPHIWLDPIILINITQKMLGEIVQKDPTNKEYYEKNAQNLISKLNTLNNEFATKLKNCQTNKIVTSHAAFGYLAKRYNLNQIAVSGLSPDEEPSPRELAELSDFIKQNKIKYIFFETLISPKFAETLAIETGASTLEFNPLEGLTHEQIQNSQDYFLIQRQNLENLRIALQCK